MAVLDELINEISDAELRKKIQGEVSNLRDTKKFGLVFEPSAEFFPRDDLPVKKNSLVAKVGKLDEVFTVTEIVGDEIFCVRGDENFSFNRSEVVSVARLGSPIYPGLTKLNEVCNAADDELWHVLIEAENYHALQLLNYPFAGKVDCIYIDPPYNTGARDWKYNNNYVDAVDRWRHSKWLSMMERRLKLAKKLLKDDGALIVTIDDNEYATLYLLIQEIFSECTCNTISIQMNPGGTQGKAFSVTNEYAIVVYSKATEICRKVHVGGDTYNLRRWGSTSNRYEGATCFYPIILDESNNVIDFGEVLPNDEHPSAQVEIKPDGKKYVWPLDVRNNEKKWRYARSTVESVKHRMFVEEHDNRIEIFLRRETEPPKTIWTDAEYNAEAHGTKLLKGIIGKGKFSYPKSLYATKDCLALIVANKPDALIVDFFAGSGTTLHAVNLLNAEDGGRRRCILVTNNESNIARSVTWQRTVCSINGRDVNGTPLKGNYLGSERAMSDGFATNAVFFTLNCLDKNSVELGEQFNQTLPVLWLRAGGHGQCPTFDEKTLPPYKIFAENKFAVLFDESHFAEFAAELTDTPLETIFIVTGSDASLKSMSKNLRAAKSFRLYKDYLENFKIGGDK